MFLQKEANKCQCCGLEAGLVVVCSYNDINICESCFEELKKLEKPKVKVKKWQWLIYDKEDSSVYTTNSRFTCEAEVVEYFKGEENDKILYPIMESEIEVDCE